MAEVDGFFLNFLPGLEQVDRVVRDALQVIDGVQQGVDGAVVLAGKCLGTQLDQIGTQNVLVMVHSVFLAVHLVGNGFIPLVGQGHGLQQGGAADLGHIAAGQHSAANGNGRGGKQAFVQQGMLLARLILAVRHGQDGQLFQHAVERQQDGGGHNVEYRVHNGNAKGVGGFVVERESQQRMQPVKTAQEHQRADEVKVQMNKCGALSIFVGTGRGDQRGNGGADVLAHDDGNRRRIGDGTGGGEGLQNTHRSGGRLQHSRQHGTGQHAQNRVFEAQKQVHEPGLIGQRTHGGGHGVHTGHQDGKAHHDLAHAAAAVLILAQHIKEDADKAKDGGPRVGVQHLDGEGITLQA